MSSLFPWDGKNLTMSGEGSLHEVSQSVHGGGRRISTNASRQDQGGGGGTSFRDRPTTVDGNSNKKHAA